MEFGVEDYIKKLHSLVIML